MKKKLKKLFDQLLKLVKPTTELEKAEAKASDAKIAAEKAAEIATDAKAKAAEAAINVTKAKKGGKTEAKRLASEATIVAEEAEKFAIEAKELAEKLKKELTALKRRINSEINLKKDLADARAKVAEAQTSVNEAKIQLEEAEQAAKEAKGKKKAPAEAKVAAAKITLEEAETAATLAIAAAKKLEKNMDKKSPSPIPAKGYPMSPIVGIFAVILLIIILSIIVASSVGKTKDVDAKATASATTTQVSATATALATTEPTATPTLTKEEALAQANKILAEAGWKPDQYTITAVDASKDKSTSGAGAFGEKVTDIKGLQAYLKSGTAKSKALLQNLVNIYGKNRLDKILNQESYIAVQSLIEFMYTGNTIYKNGATVAVGPKDGNNGDIFFLLIIDGKETAIRGACVNPQVVLPTPKDPKQDPVAKGNAPVGGGLNEDPGPGSTPLPASATSPTTNYQPTLQPPPTGARINPTPPPPELGAPTELDPETGRVSPPGR